jgi:hypothetical protein
MLGIVTIFSKVSSDGVSIAISFWELFSIVVDAEGGGTTAAGSFESSSSLRRNIWIQQNTNKAAMIIDLRRRNLRVSFEEVKQRCMRVFGS